VAERVIQAIAVALLVVAAPARAQDTSVLLFTADEQIPLTTYAEFLSSGILRITRGSAGDIPTIDSLRFIRVSRTGWSPVAVMAASGELFKTEYAERRMIPIAVRPVGVSAVAVRVADLENPERVAELHRAVGQPEGGDSAYFFLIYTSGQVTQYYPFRVRQTAK
jgi:hypothetical protein